MRRPSIVAVALAVVLAGCEGDDAPIDLTVFAASSLGGAFEELGATFEGQHDGVIVTFNLGPSDGLAAQIASEGTADVFASASQTWMDAAAEDPGVDGRVNFATNKLAIVTPPDDPAGIGSIEDLARPGVKLVLAAEGVPAGDYAREALANVGVADEVLANVVSNEEDDASVVAKVASGDADAAIVYTSDISAAVGNDVRAIEIPSDVNVVASYPIATVVGTEQLDLAQAFVDLIAGPEGQAVLARYGFGPPAG